jgi:hypothetical protein
MFFLSIYRCIYDSHPDISIHINPYTVTERGPMKYNRLVNDSQGEHRTTGMIARLKNKIYGRKLGRLNQEKDRTNSFTIAYILAVIIISTVITMAASSTDVYMLISCTAVLLSGISMIIGIFVRHMFNLDVFIAVNKGMINDEGDSGDMLHNNQRPKYTKLKNRMTLMPRMELRDIIEMS